MFIDLVYRKIISETSVVLIIQTELTSTKTKPRILTFITMILFVTKN